MVKHVLMFVLVVWGVIAWRRLKVRVATLRAALPSDLQARL